MDVTIGRLLKTLEDEKIAGNTLVLFFSDNGGPLANGATNTPLRGGKATAFEGGIRVPAILRSPAGSSPGRFHGK
jgi:Arylsulfatase A and related enzymes